MLIFNAIICNFRGSNRFLLSRESALSVDVLRTGYSGVLHFADYSGSSNAAPMLSSGPVAPPGTVAGRLLFAAGSCTWYRVLAASRPNNAIATAGDSRSFHHMCTPRSFFFFLFVLNSSHFGF